MTRPGSQVEALLARALAGERRSLRGAVFAAIVAALAAVVLLGLSGWFLAGAGLAGLAGAAAVSGFNYLVPSAFIRLCAIGRTGGRYFERLLSHRAALRALAGVRVALMARLAACDPRQARALSGSGTAARLTADVDALEDRIVRMPAGPAALAACGMALGLVWLASPWAALPVALAFLALPGAVSLMARRLVDLPAAEAQRLLGRLKAEMADMLAAGAEIAVYGLAGQAAERLQESARRMDAARRKAAIGVALSTGLLTAAAPMLAGLVLLMGAGPVPAGAPMDGAPMSGAPLLAGAALAVLAAAEMLAGPVRARLEESRTTAGLQQLEPLLAGAHGEQGPSAAEPPADPPAADVSAGVEIGGLRLAPGEVLALTGRSGSGKTRILETLAGLRADAPQRLRVGGQDPRAMPFAALVRLFALAPQDPVLIAGSIADNLRLARAGLSDEDLWQALETACLADEVRALPEGLLTWLGDGAVRLSGGQRKRLALARALLAGRPWLLLDEPGEGLDAATEALLAERLGGWMAAHGVGALIATHRPAMAATASRRLDLDASR